MTEASTPARGTAGTNRPFATRATALLALVLATATFGPTPLDAICQNPSPGPDVIVGNLIDVGSSYTDATGVNGIQAYSVGTRSVNIGDKDLSWISGNNRHPVIGQQMYRYKQDVSRPAGRFEMIGMSWLKHGFTALAHTDHCGGSCTFESGHSSGNWLGQGCSDPYVQSLNANQTNLGPRGQVNAFSGDYPYDSSHAPGTAPSAINKRLQVANVDVDPALNTGALYFVEGQYVSSDDATQGNGTNNASYRAVNIDGSLNLSLPSSGTNLCPWANGTSSTNCTKPAVFAWKEIDPEVLLVNADAPNEGRFHAAQKVRDNGDGTWRYEYLIHNMNSDRSARGFSVQFPASTTFTNPGFHAPPHHSGDCLVADPPVPGNVNACGPAITAEDWTITTDGPTGSISWITADYATTPEANALRWGTSFNFWFDADLPPSSLVHTLTFFKPGAGGDPASMEIVFALFEDGFEGGNTMEWSTVTP